MQRLLVHANRAGIKGRFAVLGLRKEHHASAQAHCIHRCLDQRVSAHGQDHRIGAAAFGLLQDPLDHVFAACVDRILEAVIRPRWHGARDKDRR